MSVTWLSGPPPGRGRWWIAWTIAAGDGGVEPVEVGAALINPQGRLLLKTSGGVAYDFAEASKLIAYHARLECPPPPETP